MRSESDWDNLFSCVDIFWPPGVVHSLRTEVMPLYATSQCHTLAGPKLRKTPSWIVFWLREGSFLYYEICIRQIAPTLFWFGQEMSLNVLLVFILWLLVGFHSFQEREYNDKYHWGGRHKPQSWLWIEFLHCPLSPNEKTYLSIHWSNK